MGWGAIPILRKNCNQFALFPFITNLSQMINWRFFIYSTYFFLLQPPFLSTQTPFNQSPFLFEKSTKAYGCRYYVFFFFKMQNLQYQNIKNVFWKRLIEPVKHLCWGFLQKKLTAYSRKKTISAKNPTLDIWEGVLNNTNSYFDESYSPNINTSTKSVDLM